MSQLKRTNLVQNLKEVKVSLAFLLMDFIAHDFLSKFTSRRILKDFYLSK